MIDPDVSAGRSECSSCGFALEEAAHRVPAADGAFLISVCGSLLPECSTGTWARVCAVADLVPLHDFLVGEQRQSAQATQAWGFPAQDARAIQASCASASSCLWGTGCRTGSWSRSRTLWPRTRSPSRRQPGNSEPVATGPGTGPGSARSWMPGSTPWSLRGRRTAAASMSSLWVHGSWPTRSDRF